VFAYGATDAASLVVCFHWIKSKPDTVASQQHHRIRGHLKNDKGDLWTRAANHHSRTLRYNTVCRKDLRKKAAK